MSFIKTFVAAVLFGAGLFGGIATAQEDAVDRLDAAKAAGSLEFNVYRDFPPYSYEKDGKYVGVDVDLANALAGLIGLNAKIRTFIPGDDLEEDLRNQLWRGTVVGGGVADVMMHVGADPQYVARQQQVSIFGIYYREAVSLSVNPAAFPNDASIESLEGHKVAVELGSIADLYLTNWNDGALRQSLVRFPTADAAVKSYVTGAADAVIAPRGELQGLLKIHKADPQKASVPQPIQFSGLFRSAWEIGIAVKKDSPKLRDALANGLAKLIDNGELKAIYARHGLDYATPGR